VNRLNDMGIIVIGTIVVICALGGYISSKFMGNDNAVEELAEDVIEDNTGVKIDLSPGSPEVKPTS